MPIEFDTSQSQVKVLNERDTRNKLVSYARRLGFEKDLLIILRKYDNLLRNCTNEQERKDMGKLGSYEVYRLLGGGGEFYVDGQLVSKDK